LASLIVGNELGDVIGEEGGLVVHDEMTAVRDAHTLPHVGQQQLVEQCSVSNHKVSCNGFHPSNFMACKQNQLKSTTSIILQSPANITATKTIPSSDADPKLFTFYLSGSGSGSVMT